MFSVMSDMSGNMDSLMGVPAAATLLAFTLIVPMIQHDSVAKAILSPQSLRARRTTEAILRLQKFLRLTFTKVREQIALSRGDAKCRTEVLQSEDDLERIASDVFRKDEYTEILAVDEDHEEDQNSSGSSKELHLFLSLEGGKRFVKVPLVPFCMILSKKFKDVRMSNTFCFVAEASGGLGPRVLNEVLQGADAGVVRYDDSIIFGDDFV